jgi:hypothetical protein
MSSEIFTNYWIGQPPTTGPDASPTLNEMPAYVNVVPLAFVTIDSSFELNFDFLCSQNSAAAIQAWIKDIQGNGTKVTFSINSSSIADITDADAFALNVQQNMEEWGVDGVDIDFEPPSNSQNVLNVVNALRATLGDDALLTAPIYSPWTSYPDFLREFAAPLDYLTTMDYTPYVGYDNTIALFEQYAQAIGTSSEPAYNKLAIGVSCMGPSTGGNFTPLDDVKKLAAWEPEGGTKQGMMLYTFSYDVETRQGSGTGYPDGTFTETIHEYLP